jgi:hypothetical protein
MRTIFRRSGLNRSLSYCWRFLSRVGSRTSSFASLLEMRDELGSLKMLVFKESLLVIGVGFVVAELLLLLFGLCQTADHVVVLFAMPFLVAVVKIVQDAFCLVRPLFNACSESGRIYYRSAIYLCLCLLWTTLDFLFVLLPPEKSACTVSLGSSSPCIK